MKKDKLNFIDLFAGCGGFSEGFLKSGHFNALAHVEWELPMVDTLRKRLVDKWKHTTEEAQKRVVHFDIRKTKELINGNWSEESKRTYAKSNHAVVFQGGLKEIIGKNKVDVIIGGPPCQAYSIHGRATDSNSMAHDYRNFLFESFAKIVQSFQPKIFVFENVPGILSAEPGGIPITNRIYDEFKKIGYTIPKPSELAKTVFDAADFQVPQNRKRVLIVGIKKGSKINIDEFYGFLKKKQLSNSKVTVKDAIGALPAIYPLEKPIKKEGKNVSHGSPNTKITQHVPRYNNKRDIEIFREWVERKMNYVPHEQKVKYYLKKTKRKTLYSKYRSLEWDKQSYTIVAHLQKDGLMFIHPDSKQARSITIREAALLMSFPMDFEFVGSSSYCYKMIGNAVPVNLAEAIALSINKVLSN